MRRLLVTAMLVLVLDGCATTRQPPPVNPPTGADDLVFQLVELPGLLPPGESFKVPRMSLYGDGGLVLGDLAQTAIPRLTQRQLTAAGVRRVVQAAADAGLTGPTDYGTPQLADAGVSVFTVVTTVTRIVAPAQVDGVTQPQRDARERVRSFVNKLADLDAWLGDDIATSPQPYAYAQLAIFALPQEPNPGAPQRPWPLGDLATASEPHGVGRCLVVSGAELSTIRDVATDVPPNTQWRSGDQLFHLVFRPLLRNERACHDLG